jgi:hypothetical protein
MTKILKISAPFINYQLTYIYNKTFTTGFFPTHLKYTVIKPIFNKGDKNNVADYRSISLLPSFSKVCEKLYMKEH